MLHITCSNQLQLISQLVQTIIYSSEFTGKQQTNHFFAWKIRRFLGDLQVPENCFNRDKVSLVEFFVLFLQRSVLIYSVTWRGFLVFLVKKENLVFG